MNILKRKILPLAVGVLIVVLAAGCSGSTTPTATTTSTSSQPASTTSTTAQSVRVDLIAKNLKFDKNTITVPAGAQVTVVFDNQDASIPHNFAVYTDSVAGTAIFKGQNISGVKQTIYTFTAPSAPGNYFFRCDVHPVLMTGTFVVQ